MGQPVGEGWDDADQVSNPRACAVLVGRGKTCVIDDRGDRLEYSRSALITREARS